MYKPTTYLDGFDIMSKNLCIFEKIKLYQLVRFALHFSLPSLLMARYTSWLASQN